MRQRPVAARHARPWSGRGPALRRGFTLIELMVVVAIIAIAVGVASLALRDPADSQLEREGVRLAALLESARAEARASGLAARWEPLTLDTGNPQADKFHFAGLPPSSHMPTHWLNDDVQAEVVGARAVVLGPEAIIPAQRIVLRLDRHRVVLGTDGLAPFSITDSSGNASP